jgi:hypothetical protein
MFAQDGQLRKETNMPVSKKTMLQMLAGAWIASMLLLTSVVAIAQSQENPQVTALLVEAREKAAVLAKDADEMESLLRSDVTWQTHADMLNRIKDHANSLAKDVEKMVAARSSASPWQQQAIDRMLPMMRELAANTTAAIKHLNENKIRPTTGNYAAYLKENTETAQQLSEMISSYVRYGETKAKLQNLEQKLEIASR